ncbi:MAG: hypothetical protein EPO08_03225 [Rhodospirillaceae bacterium]|nr:MAG: hypothetical protein EPO08_03225 [Rhodospirillaceae bacterium]
MLKKIGIGIGVIILIAAGAFWYLFSNLDSLIKAGIEKYGSAATQASVTVSGVKLSLSSGEGSITGLNVGNPKGFTTPNALALGAITVQLDTGSITGNGPIVVKEIVISQPQVTYEVGGGGSNLQTIQKNTKDFAGAGGSTSNSSGSTRKEIIENLYVRDGQIGVSASALGGKTITVPLPTIHLTNIGKGNGGATPAEIADQVLGAISSEAAKVGANALAQQVEGAVGGALSGAAQGTQGVGGQLKGLFGQ